LVGRDGWLGDTGTLATDGKYLSLGKILNVSDFPRLFQFTVRYDW
jgi:hypothetical protein